MKELEQSQLGCQIQMMNKRYVRLTIFKNLPFDMSFSLDLNVNDIASIVEELTEEKIKLIRALQNNSNEKLK